MKSTLARCDQRASSESHCTHCLEVLKCANCYLHCKACKSCTLGNSPHSDIGLMNQARSIQGGTQLLLLCVHKKTSMMCTVTCFPSWNTSTYFVPEDWTCGSCCDSAVCQVFPQRLPSASAKAEGLNYAGNSSAQRRNGLAVI